MLKALLKKKLQEFLARKVLSLFPVLLVASLAPLVGLWFDNPPAIVLSHLPLLLLGGFLGLLCAGTAFEGDFINQANRFLEYLPVRRSSVWLAGYLSGLAILGLAAISLLWLEVLLFPLDVDAELVGDGPRPDLLLAHLVPNRLALAVSCGSILFWAFSVAAFPVAYLEKKDERPGTAPLWMILGGIWLVLAIVATLSLLGTLPSGAAISPVLLTSALLYSLGSYALFALVPRHIAPTKHGLLGVGLFLAITGVLLGQLCVKHLSWRVLDPSRPLEVERVFKPPLEGKPDLVLAEVRSFRSGEHYVSLDVERGAYHDLGRRLRFVEVPDNDTGLLHFLCSPYPAIELFQGEYLTTMSPDGTGKRSLEIPRDQSFHSSSLRWLSDREIFVYRAYFDEAERTYLCVADAAFTLIKRFELSGGSGLLVNSAGQALVLAPREPADDENARGASVIPKKPYMIIDLDSDSIDRFGLPGEVVCFAEDLSRVICSLARIENGRQYKSYVVVDLPSLEERLILAEEEFPPREITSPVNLRVSPRIVTNRDEPRSLLRVNDAFDAALWVKQRVEGDHFCYSIVLIDLDTAEQTVVVPESAAPRLPVVSTGRTPETPISVHRFTADQAAFTYAIGLQTYLCDIDSRESILLADNSIAVDTSEEDPQKQNATEPMPATEYSPSDYSPSGRRVLRTANRWQTVSRDPWKIRFKFSAVEAFENGKPVRLYTGQRPVEGALWLDDERIVFFEDEAIYRLEASGGPPRQIFPPVGSAPSD